MVNQKQQNSFRVPSDLKQDPLTLLNMRVGSFSEIQNLHETFKMLHNALHKCTIVDSVAWGNYSTSRANCRGSWCGLELYFMPKICFYPKIWKDLSDKWCTLSRVYSSVESVWTPSSLEYPVIWKCSTLCMHAAFTIHLLTLFLHNLNESQSNPFSFITTFCEVCFFSSNLSL